MKHRLRNGFLLALPVLLVWAFLQAGNYLSSPAQSPERSDIILALGGDNGGRVVMAARLYKQGYAPRVMLTGLEHGHATTRLAYLDWRVQFLLEEKVPRSAVILESEAENTWQEAVNTLALLKQHEWMQVMVVSDPPHMRRLHWVWSKVFANSGKKFVLVQSAAEWWNPARWWEGDQSGPFVAMEFVKLAYYGVRY